MMAKKADPMVMDFLRERDRQQAELETILRRQQQRMAAMADELADWKRKLLEAFHECGTKPNGR